MAQQTDPSSIENFNKSLDAELAAQETPLARACPGYLELRKFFQGRELLEAELRRLAFEYFQYLDEEELRRAFYTIKNGGVYNIKGIRTNYGPQLCIDGNKVSWRHEAKLFEGSYDVDHKVLRDILMILSWAARTHKEAREIRPCVEITRDGDLWKVTSNVIIPKMSSEESELSDYPRRS
ncbi:hypothetical protein NHQ30_008404 [Ciborinia camelliae]|nr:hypothetical protein NHQ30_008404 [Ciborinia camelliae]